MSDNIVITAPRDLVSGEPVVADVVAGFARSAAAAGESVELVRGGVYTVTVSADEDVEAGQVIRLDGGKMTAGKAGEPFGTALADAPAADGVAAVNIALVP